MNILLTGCSGWLGGEIFAELNKNSNNNIVGLSRSNAYNLKDWIQFDIRYDEINKIIKNKKLFNIDAIIHCAGLAHDESADEHKMNDINVRGTKKIVSLSKYLNCKQFIFISSMSVYDLDRANGCKISEEYKHYSNSPYGKSKKLAEDVITCNLNKWKIIRLATLYGNKDKGNFKKLSKFLKKWYFPQIGSGINIKSIIRVDHAAKIITLLLKNKNNFIVNVASEDPVELRVIYNSFYKLLNIKHKLIVPQFVVNILIATKYMLEKINVKIKYLDYIYKITQSNYLCTDKLKNLLPGYNIKSDFSRNFTECKNYE